MRNKLGLAFCREQDNAAPKLSLKLKRTNPQAQHCLRALDDEQFRSSPYVRRSYCTHAKVPSHLPMLKMPSGKQKPVQSSPPLFIKIHRPATKIVQKVQMQTSFQQRKVHYNERSATKTTRPPSRNAGTDAMPWKTELQLRSASHFSFPL